MQISNLTKYHLGYYNLNGTRAPSSGTRKYLIFLLIIRQNVNIIKIYTIVLIACHLYFGILILFNLSFTFWGVIILIFAEVARAGKV